MNPSFFRLHNPCGIEKNTELYSTDNFFKKTDSNNNNNVDVSDLYKKVIAEYCCYEEI